MTITNFTWGITEISGWHYSDKWLYYQKTNGRVVCYISIRILDGYMLQLYKRGELTICDIEYRSNDLNELLTLADEWLDKYQEGNLETLHKHYYSPHNSQGFWAVEYPNRHLLKKYF